MSQLLNTWKSLSNRQKVILALAGTAVFALVLGIARIAASPNMALLYNGLESGPAGDVVRALEQRGAIYEVRGGAIYVDSTQRDELRMTLASEGLPANSGGGYEILDTLSGFGTTSQMFDAAYWRAKEGELARTIVGASNISAARVHIAHSGRTPFQRRVKPTASVTVSTTSGEVTPDQAHAFKFLVASAVTGLAPEDVAIIDSAGRLIGAPSDTSETSAIETKSAALANKVRRLLEARVGYGNVAVEVSIDTVTESELIRERRFDPNERVAISTDSEERNTNAKNENGGQVTVASNLPDGDAGAKESSRQNSETRERINYEVSETQREISREAGAIRRITVAVLVNGIEQTAPDGTVSVISREDQELEVMRELVQSAIGFDEARGDVVTLKSMGFEPLAEEQGTPISGLSNLFDFNLMSLIQLAILALVVLLLGLFVVRPILTKPSVDAPLLPAELPREVAQTQPTPQALTGEIQNVDDDFDLADTGRINQTPARVNGGDTPADPVERLRNLIADRQEETVEILRNWLEEPKEHS